MAQNAVTTRPDFSLMEEVIIKGDLAKLTPEQRAHYYLRVCESVGLNPHTQPFSYLSLNGKLVLYVNKTATDQLRGLHNVSTEIVSREYGDAAIVTVRASTPDGRTDESIGAVWIKGLAGDAYVNAIMKAETKGKRRATLALMGLGMLDESETETIRGARPVNVDEDGVIQDEPATITARAEPPAIEEPGITQAQINLVWTLAEKVFGDESDEKVYAHIARYFPHATQDDKPSLRALTRAEASQMIGRLTQAEKKIAEAQPELAAV